MSRARPLLASFRASSLVLALAGALALLAPGTARALDGNDALVVSLAGGTQVRGWYFSLADGVLTLSGDNRFQQVPLAAITAVERDGAPLPMERFLAEAAAVQARLDAFRADPPPHPAPGAIVAASVVWAGAAPAMVGDRRRFWAYTGVETVLVGTAALNLRAGSAGVLVPLLALDVLFKGYAAGQAVRLSKRRRAQLRPASTPMGSESPPAR